MIEHEKISTILNRIVKAKFPNKIIGYYSKYSFVWIYKKNSNYYCTICDELMYCPNKEDFSDYIKKSTKHGLKHLEEFNLLSFL